ncbi:MAG: hypothetical protein JJT90_11440 [Ectothiorhodospiraceae bacterium]|nr:hypothetical protein [Ectothiorhodospiraceae bacterium]
MNWQKDMERMVAGWTETQQRMWDSWMDSVRQFTQRGLPRDDWRQTYEQNLEAWERSVQQALEAQKTWAHKWSEAMGGAPDAPEAARAYSEQVQTMMQGWTESQRQLWSAWFESMRDMDPQRPSTAWEEESRQVMEAWQQAAERARETLDNWARSMPLAGLDAGSEAPTGRAAGHDRSRQSAGSGDSPRQAASKPKAAGARGKRSTGSASAAGQASGKSGKAPGKGAKGSKKP